MGIEPQFLEFYNLNVQQKQDEGIDVGTGVLVLGLAVIFFLLTISKWKESFHEFIKALKDIEIGLPPVKKLLQETKFSEDVARLWLTKQAIWQIYLSTPKHIPSPTLPEVVSALNCEVTPLTGKKTSYAIEAAKS